MKKNIQVNNRISNLEKKVALLENRTVELQKKKSKFDMFATIVEALSEIATVILGILTLNVYLKQLDITKVQNEPVFYCSYNTTDNELHIKKTNGKLNSIYIKIQSIYLSSVIDCSNNNILFNGLPFSVNPTPMITVEQADFEEYSADLLNANIDNTQFAEEFTNCFRDTKYGCQIDIAYVIEIEYRNEYKRNAIEHKYYVLKTENYTCENTNGIIISYSDVNNNVYNPAEFKTGQVIQVDDNADCVYALNKMIYEWNNDYSDVQDISDEEARQAHVGQIIDKLVGFHDKLKEKHQST